MKSETLILSLIICAFFSVADGSRYMKDEYSDGLEREYDDGNRFAVNQTRDFKKSRAGQINESDNDEIDLPESDPPERDLNEDDDDGPPERDPPGRDPPRRSHPGRGPPGRGPHRKGPRGRGPPSFDEDGYINDDEGRFGNYGRRPPNRGSLRRGRPSFNDDDYVNDNNKNKNYDNSENGGRNDESENKQLRRGSIGRNN